MSLNTNTIATIAALAALQFGLFAWLRNDIRSLAERVQHVETEVAFVRGQLSLALPGIVRALEPRPDTD